jgi:SAM-dependent methyltransferase
LDVRALLSDVGQRVLTANKRQQKRDLTAWLHELRLPADATLLDFGCGTGLFGRALAGAGVRYCGFDPDAAAIRYASRRYPELRFVAALDEATAAGPFDVVLANCCFHHIPDEALVSTTLPAIERMMHSRSMLLLVDVLPLARDASLVRRLYNGIEQGDRKRTAAELERLVAGRFALRSSRVRRSFAFSVANPIYNDLIALELVPA